MVADMEVGMVADIKININIDIDIDIEINMDWKSNLVRELVTGDGLIDPKLFCPKASKALRVYFSW